MARRELWNAETPLDQYREYYARAYDIATGTTNRSRREVSLRHRIVTAQRNAVPHVGEAQRERMRKRIFKGKTGLLPVKERAAA